MSSSHSSQRRSVDSPALLPFPGLYDREAGDERLTLRACYEKFLLPDLRCKSKNTRSAYRTALNHWERVTDDPPVSELSDELVTAFRDALIAGGMQPSNLAKQFRHLRPIWRRIGPREFRNPRGKHLIDVVPHTYVESPDEGDSRIADLDELSDMHRQAAGADWPSKGNIPAPLWWRTVWVMEYNYGFRTGDLVRIRDTHVGLRWKSIHWESECPHKKVRLKNEHGWLEYTPTKTKKRKKKALYLPLTATAATHLRAIQSHAGRTAPESPVLPSSISPGQFRQRRDAICTRAKIDDPYTLRDLRSTCTTEWDVIDPGLGDYVLGHAPQGVNARYYLVVIKRLIAAAAKLPQPAAFSEPL